MRNRNYVPFQSKAKFPAVCPETNKPIAKGDEAVFYRKNGKWIAFHVDSKTAESFRALQFAQAWNMADSNY